MSDSLDDVLEYLAQERPGWGWSVSHYSSSDKASAFLHRPLGAGVVHKEGATPAEALRNCIQATDEKWIAAMDQASRVKREEAERAEYQRLKAKYGASEPSRPASDIAKEESDG